MQTPDNATYEYHFVGLGRATLLSGGCYPDPLAQPTRHISETVNITKPHVPRVSSNATPEACVSPPPNVLESKESPGLGLVGSLAIALSLVLLRRRQLT